MQILNQINVKSVHPDSNSQPSDYESLPLTTLLPEKLVFITAMGSKPRPRINRPRTHQRAHAGNLCLFTAANEDFIDIFLI